MTTEEQKQEDDQPKGEMVMGIIIPGPYIDTKFEYVTEFTDPEGQSMYMRLEDLTNMARAVLLNDMATGNHRIWGVQYGPEFQGDWTFTKLMVLRENGFEMLQRDVTGETLN